MTCVASWSFGLPAVVAAAEIMEQGGSCLDAVEKGINGEPNLSICMNTTDVCIMERQRTPPDLENWGQNTGGLGGLYVLSHQENLSAT